LPRIDSRASFQIVRVLSENSHYLFPLFPEAALSFSPSVAPVMTVHFHPRSCSRRVSAERPLNLFFAPNQHFISFALFLMNLHFWKWGIMKRCFSRSIPPLPPQPLRGQTTRRAHLPAPRQATASADAAVASATIHLLTQKCLCVDFVIHPADIRFARAQTSVRHFLLVLILQAFFPLSFSSPFANAGF